MGFGARAPEQRRAEQPSGGNVPADLPSPESAASETAAESEPPPTVDQVKMALRRVKDPDLQLNIIDLGLVYDISVDDRAVKVDMSLTSPAWTSARCTSRAVCSANAASPSSRPRRIP